jgi:hypothetical protein
MILSTANLAHYLIDRGLVPASDVVDGDLVIVEVSRRNRNFKVLRAAGPGCFVKQAQDWQPYSVETLHREARCYRLAAGDPDFAALADLLPHLLAYDAERCILVTELLPGAESLAEYHGRHGSFPLEMAERLGVMLGTYHRRAGTRAREGRLDAGFPRTPPWILAVLDHNPSHLGPVSAGAAQLLGILRRYPEFRTGLDAVRAEWRHDALIHGDMKWENCMVLPGEGPAGGGIRIVDWELADFGDACWDVGSLFQAYLSSWIFSMQIPSDARPEQLLGGAQFPIERMQPAMGTFWRSYVSTLGAGAPAAAELLRRSMLYAAARMVQTAWEHTAAVPQVSTHVVCLLQLALNVLTRPDDAVRHLLGIQGRLAA